MATCYAIAPLIAARHLADVPALPMTAACLGFAALVYAAPAATTWPTEMPSTRVLLALAGLAVICTALAFIVFFALIREVGARARPGLHLRQPGGRTAGGSDRVERAAHGVECRRTGADPRGIRVGDTSTRVQSGRRHG